MPVEEAAQTVEVVTSTLVPPLTDTDTERAVALPTQTNAPVTPLAPLAVVVATAVVWFMLDAMHVFSTIEDLVKTVAGERSNTFSAIVAYLELPRALAVSTIIAVVDE